LRLGLVRTSGFSPGELITFSGLPFPSGERTSLTNCVGGLPIVIKNYNDHPLAGEFGPYWVELEAPGQPLDTAVDIVSVTTDTGEALPSVLRSYENYFSLPTGIKSVAVTVTMQKRRHVEFFVRPPKLTGN